MPVKRSGLSSRLHESSICMFLPCCLPRFPQNFQNVSEIPLKMPAHASKMLPRRSQDGPRGSQDALKTVQEAPKTLQRRPESPPKRSQKPPHGFQGVPRGSQEASRGSTKPRRGSNRLSGGPFGSQKFLPNTKTLRNLTFDD